MIQKNITLNPDQTKMLVHQLVWCEGTCCEGTRVQSISIYVININMLQVLPVGRTRAPQAKSRRGEAASLSYMLKGVLQGRPSCQACEDPRARAQELEGHELRLKIQKPWHRNPKDMTSAEAEDPQVTAQEL